MSRVMGAFIAAGKPGEERADRHWVGPWEHSFQAGRSLAEESARRGGGLAGFGYCLGLSALPNE